MNAESSNPTRQPPSPVETRNPLVADTFKRAAVWLGLAAVIFLVWQAIEAILLLIAGFVFAAMLDGGTRLIGRVWSGPHWARLTIIVLLVLGFLVGFFAVAGLQLATQAGELSQTLSEQLKRLSDILERFGIARIAGNEGDPLSGIASQVIGSLGRLTQAVTTVFGAIGSLILVMVLGLFIAAEPRLYERGLLWMTPVRSRARVLDIMHHIAHTLRRWVLGRLFAMVVEGLMTGVGLMIAGVPLAALLGVISGVLAFIPNIGAFIAGTLIVLVGLSAGMETGLYALGVYLAVQFIEGNVLTPFVERRVVELSPAVVLGAQLIFGVLFGLLGIALADPIIAMIKTTLERLNAARNHAGHAATASMQNGPA